MQSEFEKQSGAAGALQLPELHPNQPNNAQTPSRAISIHFDQHALHCIALLLRELSEHRYLELSANKQKDSLLVAVR